jgi:hypothetical protein
MNAILCYLPVANNELAGLESVEIVSNGRSGDVFDAPGHVGPVFVDQ